jgi:hypothetical protein
VPCSRSVGGDLDRAKICQNNPIGTTARDGIGIMIPDAMPHSRHRCILRLRSPSRFRLNVQKSRHRRTTSQSGLPLKLSITIGSVRTTDATGPLAWAHYVGWVAERSKARAWKVRIRQKRIVGSNPTSSANDYGKLLLLVRSGHPVDNLQHKGELERLSISLHHTRRQRSSWHTRLG